MKLIENLVRAYEILVKEATKLYFVVFSGLVLAISLYYNYPSVLLLRPQSVHNWRQCDGASLALCYYQEGMHFFKPQTQGLYSDNLTTGFASPSEIPILYYMVAVLYKIFGYHEFIFRALNLFLFYLGLFYLFKFARLVLRSDFFSYTVVILLFSSPIIVYYANNFMPNTGALSFSLIGWYYFYRYYLNKKTGTFLLSILFFGLAGAMKITELSGPIIIAVFMAADRLGLLNLQLDSKRQFLIKSVALVAIFAIVTAWVMYAKAYNNHHISHQFSTFTFPIWNLDRSDIAFVLHKMHVIWFKDYYYPRTFYFMLACIPLTIIFYKRSNRILLIASFIQLAGLLLYSMLWFEALGDHDYFFISFYILPVFLFINFFVILKSFRLPRAIMLLLQAGMLLFLIHNITHAKVQHEIRYHSWMNDFNEMQDVYTVKPYLKRINIHRGDTVVFYPSIYLRPLYLMNLKGWTIRQYDSVTSEVIKKDSLQMREYVARGARYFITSDIKSLTQNKSLLPYAKDLCGKFGSVYIFRITREGTKSFYPYQPPF